MRRGLRRPPAGAGTGQAPVAVERGALRPPGNGRLPGAPVEPGPQVRWPCQDQCSATGPACARSLTCSATARWPRPASTPTLGNCISRERRRRSARQLEAVQRSVATSGQIAAVAGDYIELRRGLGYRSPSQERALRALARHLGRDGHDGPSPPARSPGRAAAMASPDPCNPARRLATVRGFLPPLSSLDALTPLPAPPPLP